MLVKNSKFKDAVSKVVCGFYELADVGRMHPMRERSLRALQRSLDYVERAMPDALGFDTRRELIAFSLSAVEVEGHYLEFGVFTGGTVRLIAGRIDGRIVHGFDSFEGLPESWSGFNLGKGAFDMRGRLPRVPKNVRLHRGWFEQSLPAWLKVNPGAVAFVHVDCDLYTAARTVLALLGDRIVPGTVIVFDEYFNFPSWEQHEYKAFQEFVAEHSAKYHYLAFARQQVAVRIESINGSVS